MCGTEDLHVSQDDREQRDLHALTEEGMVLCNPRDREAAHRTEMEGIGECLAGVPGRTYSNRAVRSGGNQGVFNHDPMAACSNLIRSP